MIKGSIQQQDITLINIYACNIEIPIYTRQILTNINGEIDSKTIIKGIQHLTYFDGQITQTENQ